MKTSSLRLFSNSVHEAPSSCLPLNHGVARCFVTSSVSRSIDDFHFRKSFPFHHSMIRKQSRSGFAQTLKKSAKALLIFEGVLLLGSYGFWRRLNTSQGELLRLVYRTSPPFPNCSA